MQSGMSPLDTGADVRAERRSATLCTLGAAAFVGLTLCVAGPVSSETLSSNTVQLHEGEVFTSSVPSLSNESETLRVARSTVGGLAPGHSTGASGLQLQGSVVAVPEPSSALQGVAAVLGLALLTCRRDRVRS
jgi:hypothetical protein